MSGRLKKARRFSLNCGFSAFAMLLVLALSGCSFFGGNTTTQTLTPTTSSYAASGLLHVQGTQLVDANGHPVVLRGADIGTSFSNMKSWQRGKRPTDIISSATLTAMAQQWHMNALRLQVSNWIYAKYPSDFLSQLDQIVQEANQVGLYVIINLEDDGQGGSPYTSKGSTVPKTEDITFWKAIAAHYKPNPMVLFDLYNEPQEPNWNTWLHGGGTTPDGATIVGFQDLVNAVRSTGAQQIVVLEPGSAGHSASGNGNAAAEEGGWATFPLSDAIQDPNTMYSLHVYQTIIQPASAQSAKWGPVLNHYPLFYGEWAFLTNGVGKSASAHCQGLPTNGTQANQVVENFLNYMASIHANWTAWQFAQGVLIQGTNDFTPTTFSSTLQCGNSKANVGMGSVVQQYLATHPS